MIRPELIILKYLLDYELYNKYRSYIKQIEDKELQTLYQLLDRLMEKQTSITFEEYSLYVLTNAPFQKDILQNLLDVLQKTQVEKDFLITILEQYRERSLAHQIALAAINVTNGKESLAQVKSLLDEAPDDIEDNDEYGFVTDDLEELHDNHIKKRGLRWRLRTLNRIFGSLRRGNFGFIFARPETGKTTFLASESTFFAEQLAEEDGPILWFNNEEEGKTVQIRIIQASLGIDLQTLFSDVKRYKKEYATLTRNKIKIVDQAIISKQDVEKYCKKFKPSLIIFDQLDKVKGFDGDRDDLRLGSLYQWARELAKTYCPVIAVCQADGSGEGKKWLTMENVANAKTAKQAEADWILGIGASHQEGFEYVRHLHASKNKLPGDDDSDPKMRHGKADCIIQPIIARYADFE